MAFVFRRFVLNAAHRLALRPWHGPRSAVESKHAPLEVALAEVKVDASDPADLMPATPEQRKAKVASQPWMAPQELDDAGFEDTMPSAPAELSATPEQAHPRAGPPGDDDAAGPTAQPADADQRPPGDVLMSLREGSWVDLYSRRSWLRAQLIWASTRGTLFMFVSHGGQPHSMTKRSCERLITQGLLRPVEMHGVVAHAMNHLVKDATTSPTESSVAGG